MNSFKYLLMIDLDELIVPYKQDTLAELIAGGLIMMVVMVVMVVIVMMMVVMVMMVTVVLGQVGFKRSRG